MRHARLIVLAAVAVSAAPALAHPFHGSFATLLVEDGALQVEVSFFLDDLASGFRLDANRDGRLTSDEIRARLEEVYRVVEGAVEVEIDGGPVALVRHDEERLRERIGALVPPEGFPVDECDHVSIGLLFRNRLAHDPGDVVVRLALHERFGADHRTLVKLVEAVPTGHAQQHVILTAGQSSHRFSG